VTVGGTYIDTTPYPREGSTAHPLYGDDIELAIGRAQQANHWVADTEHLYAIFTGYNVQSCADSHGTDCSFNSKRQYCGYHSYSSSSTGTPFIYAYMPVVQDCLDELLREQARYGSPNQDAIADAVLDVVSHEHFEAVTDPLSSGWYDNITDEGEIADKCVDRFDNVAPNGGNVTLANGHSYLLQMEWSNKVGQCALSL
jgi:Phosphate-induced protein 1 conserved region